MCGLDEHHRVISITWQCIILSEVPVYSMPMPAKNIQADFLEWNVDDGIKCS